MRKLFTILGVLVVSACASTGEPARAKPQTDKEVIIQAGLDMGIPLEVITHVARKESTFRCSPGNPRYHGPLQVSPRSARALGYTSAEGPLNNCKAGLKYGLRHLKLCVRKVGNNPRAAAACHASPARYGVVVRWRG